MQRGPGAEPMSPRTQGTAARRWIASIACARLAGRTATWSSAPTFGCSCHRRGRRSSACCSRRSAKALLRACCCSPSMAAARGAGRHFSSAGRSLARDAAFNWWPTASSTSTPFPSASCPIATCCRRRRSERVDAAFLRAQLVGSATLRRPAAPAGALGAARPDPRTLACSNRGMPGGSRSCCTTSGSTGGSASLLVPRRRGRIRSTGRRLSQPTQCSCAFQRVAHQSGPARSSQAAPARSPC